ncbi:hypothetical protein C2S51_015203 [Perilla frutescens var. frutescens]|nr:hypothetical protein C2S51_015203 [Perilla frutescens var. frutescens]
MENATSATEIERNTAIDIWAAVESWMEWWFDEAHVRELRRQDGVKRESSGEKCWEQFQFLVGETVVAAVMETDGASALAMMASSLSIRSPTTIVIFLQSLPFRAGLILLFNLLSREWKLAVVVVLVVCLCGGSLDGGGHPSLSRNRRFSLSFLSSFLRGFNHECLEIYDWVGGGEPDCSRAKLAAFRCTQLSVWTVSHDSSATSLSVLVNFRRQMEVEIGQMEGNALQAEAVRLGALIDQLQLEETRAHQLAEEERHRNKDSDGSPPSLAGDTVPRRHINRQVRSLVTALATVATVASPSDERATVAMNLDASDLVTGTTPSQGL